MLSDLSLGAGYTLVLTLGGAVWAAGCNSFGQLGIGQAIKTVPDFVEVLSGGAQAVAAGDN